MKRKAFTLIEIILSIVISASIGMYILKQNQQSSFTSEVSKFSSALVSMIQNGVTEATVGYVSSSCQGNGDFTDITAINVNQCTGWGSYDEQGADDDVGANSYLDGKNLLGAYSNDGKGCKVYFDEDVDPHEFFIFVDCGNLSYDGGSSRYKKFVEDHIRFTLETSLSTMFQGTDENASSVTSAVGGDDEDGKVRVKFKK